MCSATQIIFGARRHLGPRPNLILRMTADVELGTGTNSIIGSSSIPQLPDDVLRLIMQKKFKNFERDMPRLRMEKRIRQAVRMEAEARAREREMACCQLKCSCLFVVLAIFLILYFFLAF